MVLLYILSIFDYYINGVAISDIGLFLLLFNIIFKYSIKIYFKKGYLILVFFSLIALISGLCNINSSFFSGLSFMRSYFKLNFYIICILVLPYFLAYNFSKVKRILINSLVFLSLLGIYQVIAHYFLPNLPYSLSPSLLSNSGYDAMHSYGEKFRIKSIYSEPAHFSIYINLIYAYLLHYRIKLNKRIHTLVIITTMLTFSLSGIALLLANYCILLLKHIMKGRKHYIIYIIIFFILISVAGYQNQYLRKRVFRAFALSEGSSVDRLLGGWELASKAPFYGVGLGNITNFHDDLSIELNFTKEAGKIHNIFAVVLATTGYFGLLIFSLFLVYLTKKNIFFILFVIISGFAWGYFNSTPFWLLLLLIATYDYFLIINNYTN